MIKDWHCNYAVRRSGMIAHYFKKKSIWQYILLHNNCVNNFKYMYKNECTYKRYLWEKYATYTLGRIRPAEYLDVVVFLDADWHPMKGPLFSRLLIPLKCHLLKMPIIQNTAFRINTLTAVLLLDHLHHTKYLAENIWKLIRLNNNSILIKINIILQNNTWSYKYFIW